MKIKEYDVMIRLIEALKRYSAISFRHYNFMIFAISRILIKKIVYICKKYDKMHIQSIIGSGVKVGMYFFVNNHR